MPEHLLKTKLFIPTTRPKLVPRPHLIKRLNEGLHRKLTLISAPAGFGKTTLVTEWLDNLRLNAKNDSQTEYKIAWLSLGEGDNDLARFLSYFIAALNHIEGLDATFGKGALSMLQSPQPPPSEIVLTSLINEISNIPDQIILVLDDYHLIDAQPIHDALSFLLDNIPPQMHLVFATREDPQIPLTRLRSKDQLTELRATDLRFTSSEAAEFLNQVMGLDISAEDATALESRTEGWIAGLQLAAISLRGQTDTSRLIQSFTGSNRLVLDYLIEEVLDQQPEEIQTFLLKTAILDRLTGSLCDALTGQNNGQVTLEMLERANLFIVPLDEERRWYRYHHLFADLLNQRLLQTQMEQIPMLHIQAIEWYEQNELIDDAIEHALRVQDLERATTLIESVAESMWWRNGHTKLRHWLDILPDKMVITKPKLCIYHAGFLFARGQHDAAECVLRSTEQALDRNTNHVVKSSMEKKDQLVDIDRMKLLGRISATRSFLASYRSDALGVIPHALQALEYLPEQDTIWRGSAAVALADAYIYQGRYEEAHQFYLEAMDAIKATDNTYLFMNISLKLALTLRARGKLSQVIQICQQQLALAIENGMSETEIVGWLFAVWGEVLAEINDLEGAIDMVIKGVDLTERGRDVAMLTWSYLCFVRVLFSRGDMGGAEEIIKETEDITRESIVPLWVTNMMAAWQVRVWLTTDKPEKIIQWMQKRELDLDSQPTYVDALEFITLARIFIAQERYDEAGKLLQRLQEQGEAGGHTTRVIDIMILQTLNFQAEGDQAKAMSTLGKALSLAEPGRFIRTFVDEGPPMEALLKRMKVKNGTMKEYVRNLLAAFQDKDSHLSSPSSQPLIEPLSERELEVLQLIAEGLTNQEIASRLFLSLNTIKVHTRNIYGKLGVNNRMQAATKAKDLEILSST